VVNGHLAMSTPPIVSPQEWEDLGVDEWHGTNGFIRDGDSVFRTYFINSRGDEVMGAPGATST
jgi:predicted dithiol-disulfide oxidoreductase (DUF899 family)